MADAKPAPATPVAKVEDQPAKAAVPASPVKSAAASPVIPAAPAAALAKPVEVPAAAVAVATKPASPAAVTATLVKTIKAKPVRKPVKTTAVTKTAKPAIKAKAMIKNKQPATSRPAPAKSAVAPRAIATQKGMMTTMNEQVKKVAAETTDRVQAMFGDVNARTKTVMEKGAKLFEDMNEFNKGNLEAVVESSKIAAKGIQTMGQDAAEMTRKSFETATGAMKSFASVKTPAELFKLQSDYAKSALETIVAESAKASEAWLKLAGEVAQPISNRYAVASEKLKSTVA